MENDRTTSEEEAAGRGDPRVSGYEIGFRDALVYRLPDFDAIPARPVRTRLLFFFNSPPPILFIRLGPLVRYYNVSYTYVLKIPPIRSVVVPIHTLYNNNHITDVTLLIIMKSFRGNAQMYVVDGICWNLDCFGRTESAAAGQM